MYALRNEIHPLNNLLPLGVIEYKLFLIGFIFPFFVGISILSTYPARLSLCSKESFNAADTLYIFPEVFDEIILAKDPTDYNGNNPHRKIGLLIGAKAGDVIWYYKTDNNKDGVSMSPQEIGICKYRDMLMTTVKDAIEIMGYAIDEK